MSPPRAPLHRNGFTLIELLIVVVIIGILAAIAIPKFSVTRSRAQKSTIMSDLKNLAHLQDVYYNENFTYTDDLDDLNATTSDGVTIDINEADHGGWAATGVHAGLFGEQCGVFHGSADPSGGDPATAAGVVACSF